MPKSIKINTQDRSALRRERLRRAFKTVDRATIMARRLVRQRHMRSLSIDTRGLDALFDNNVSSGIFCNAMARVNRKRARRRAGVVSSATAKNPEHGV